MNSTGQMTDYNLYRFSATIEVIVGNPFVFVPDNILQKIFEQAGTAKKPIPIKGTVNGKPYKQTLVNYSGAWRLYINMKMLKNSPRRIGETVEISVQYDPESRALKPPDDFVKALTENKTAKKVFDGLPASGKSEIVRYLANLKTEAALKRNITRAINFLLGKERFVGRDRP